MFENIVLFVISANVILGANYSNHLNNFEQEVYSINERSLLNKSIILIQTAENATVILPCFHKTETAPKVNYKLIRWHRDEDFLIESVSPDEEVSMKHYQLLRNGSLLIPNIQLADAGTYFCEMIDDQLIIVQKHIVEVQYPARVHLTPNGSIQLPLGATLEIICETIGVPLPIINWRMQNQVLHKTNAIGNRQTRVIEINSRKMAGKIECVASNGVGETDVDTLELTVLFSPEIEVKQRVLYTNLGSSQHLDCFVQSAPAARVRWFFKEQLVTINGHFSRQDRENPHMNGSDRNYYADMRHRLVIHYIRLSDIGVYECRAENSFGATSAGIELTLRPAPCVFKVDSIQHVLNDTSHLLIWKTESFSPIIEFLLKFRQVPNVPEALAEWKELTIPADLSIGPFYTASFLLNGLNSDRVYEAIVSARNQFGWSESSQTLQFTTKLKSQMVAKDKNLLPNDLSAIDEVNLDEDAISLSTSNLTLLQNNSLGTNATIDYETKLSQENIFSSLSYFFNRKNGSCPRSKIHLGWLLAVVFCFAEKFI